jgi:hypothetical protein
VRMGRKEEDEVEAREPSGFIYGVLGSCVQVEWCGVTSRSRVNYGTALVKAW